MRTDALIRRTKQGALGTVHFTICLCNYFKQVIQLPKVTEPVSLSSCHAITIFTHLWFAYVFKRQFWDCYSVMEGRGKKNTELLIRLSFTSKRYASLNFQPHFPSSPLSFTPYKRCWTTCGRAITVSQLYTWVYLWFFKSEKKRVRVNL